MKTRTLTVTEAARNFSDLINRTQYLGETTILTRRGKEVARLKRAEEEKPNQQGATIEEAMTWWRNRPQLPPEEAEAFARDIEAGRAFSQKQPDRWA